MENQHTIINNIDEATPELSRPIAITEIQGNYSIRQIIASREECSKLAKRFDLIKLESLSANVKISYLSSQPVVLVEGTLNATVVQQCVVTLEPVSNDISCTLSCKYSETQKEIGSEPVDIDVMTEDPPELIVGGVFDIGVLLTEYFGVELDPFPRSLRASYDTIHDVNNTNETILGNSNPFEVLRKLK